jgi:hypothetical protein
MNEIVHLWISGYSACGEGVEKPKQRGLSGDAITCLNCRGTPLFEGLSAIQPRDAGEPHSHAQGQPGRNTTMTEEPPTGRDRLDARAMLVASYVIARRC